MEQVASQWGQKWPAAIKARDGQRFRDWSAPLRLDRIMRLF
jgi:hypothetical protein